MTTQPGTVRSSASALLDLPARAAPIAVLDLEMTGLKPNGDRVCEVAVVRGTAGRVEREFQTLVRPGVLMSDGARRCTGITDTMLVGAPVFGEVAGDVATALVDAVVVAHNVDFDLGFLHREFDGTPIVLAPLVTLDTLLMARRLFAFKQNGLIHACAELGVRLDRVHRALADARACFALYHRMLEVLDPGSRLTVRDLSDLVGALAPNSALRLHQQQVLRDAFRERRSVVIDYQSTSEPAAGVRRREVDIWVLKLPKLQGWCHFRQAERVFRLDRIRNVELGTRTYEVPEGVEERI